MDNTTRKLIRIVAEAALEQRLISDVERLGAHGYTITDVRGKGNRGVREGEWDIGSNIRMEILCDDDVAHAIVEYLKAHYYDNYAMITYWSDVAVLRPEKF